MTPEITALQLRRQTLLAQAKSIAYRIRALKADYWADKRAQRKAAKLQTNFLNTGEGVHAYSRARWEHAWRLRQEGLSYRHVGFHLGISGQQAKNLVYSHEHYSPQ